MMFMYIHFVHTCCFRLRDEVARLEKIVLQYEQLHEKTVNECTDVTEHFSRLTDRLQQKDQE